MTAKEKILIAARKEFLAKGYERASLREICRDAGFAANNLYNYWNTKDELFQEVVINVASLNQYEAERHPEEFAMVVEKCLTGDDELIKKYGDQNGGNGGGGKKAIASAVVTKIDRKPMGD